ncbi:EamA-like transporter family protein [Posidoniimonas polymericola]|uniref:EamA-like transporter family protein n=1 Tax=Posidoniimonas polymericola TaxID=2528002 RepID=A0A5C5YS79_9BACT|nr:DMT family transporter [Posidoniimonas polymericola]TWT77822.1 EamA-like transporter family protein [Posidoniimonas polymericola]
MQSFLLLFGVAACATSVIWIKKSGVDPVLLSGLRLVVASVALTPLFIRDWRRHRDVLTWRHYRDAAIPGVMLALHFITWLIGVRMTPAVNSTVLVNLTPIVMPLLLIWLTGERPNRRELLATGVAGIGLSILFVSDFNLSREQFNGDLVCLGSMLLLALYLTLGRKYRHHPTVWLYLVPLYYTAAVVALLLAPVFATDLSVDWPREWYWVLALGLIPTVLGHSLLNNAMRHFRGQVVGLASMLQFIIAGVLAYLLLPNETPAWTFYPASVFILLAGVIVVGRRKSRPAASPVATATRTAPPAEGTPTGSR